MTCASGTDMNASECDSWIPSLSVSPSKPMEFSFDQLAKFDQKIKAICYILLEATVTT